MLLRVFLPHYIVIFTYILEFLLLFHGFLGPRPESTPVFKQRRSGPSGSGWRP